MIRSQKQYEAAKRQLASLCESPARKSKPNAPEALLRAARGQTAELAREIEEQLKEYEYLREPGRKEIHIRTLHDLRLTPIRYRIAMGLTIESFARVVHVHSRQIARYESEEYGNVSWETLFKILEKLNVQIQGRMELESQVA